MLLPGAQITVLSVATGAERDAVTDNTGNYVVPSLQPGEYTVQAKAAGFSLYTVKSLILQVDKAETVNITMTVASAGETVQVETRSSDRCCVHHCRAGYR